MNTDIPLKKIIYIAVIMIVTGSFFITCHNKPILELINEPIEGDLYEIKLAEDKYILYWLIENDIDSVSFKVMNTTADNKEGLKDFIQQHEENIYADKRGLYGYKSITLSKKEIKEDLDNGKILNVNRMTRFRKVK